MNEKAASAASMLVLSGVAACSLVVSSDRQQCVKDDDCRSRGKLSAAATCVANACAEAAPPPETSTDAAVDAPPADPIWGCLGKRSLPSEELSAPVRLTTRFSNVIRNLPYADESYRACLPLDGPCEKPLDGTEGKTDANGVLDVMLYRGFHGYLDVRPSEGSDLMPSLVYVHPVDPNVPMAAEYPLLASGDLTLIVGIAGRTVNPALGHVFFLAEDCQGAPAAGVRVRAESVTDESFTFYTDASGAPSTSQEFTVGGGGGFLNLAPGIIRFDITRSTGEPISTPSFVVRAGSVSFTYVGPGL